MAKRPEICEKEVLIVNALGGHKVVRLQSFVHKMVVVAGGSLIFVKPGVVASQVPFPGADLVYSSGHEFPLAHKRIWRKAGQGGCRKM